MMKRKNVPQRIRKNNPGFTLVELIFSMAILSFMLTITLTTFIGVFRFYNWSTTTRHNQASSRQVMDLMTRTIRPQEIVFVTASNLCLLDSNANEPKYTRLYRSGTQIVRSNYPTPTGGGGPCSVGEVNRQVVSDPTLQVSSLQFVQVNGALNGIHVTSPLGINDKRFFKSISITMQVTNGTINPATGLCRPLDNFCDQATFITAVTERQN